MMKDFGVDKSCVVYADSTAALAIAKRKGAGKIRHINISCLWIQEHADSKQLEMRKVLGTENPADMMTKHLARQPLDKCMLQLNQHRATGRAKTGLQVQGTGGTKAKPTGSPGAPVGGAKGREKSEELLRSVRFQPATIIEVPSWKDLTGGMNYCPQGSHHRTLYVGANNREYLKARGPSRGHSHLGVDPGRPAGGGKSLAPVRRQESGTRLSSLQVCTVGPSQAPGRPVADEQPDQATLFQDGGQGHKRRGAENISVR